MSLAGKFRTFRDVGFAVKFTPRVTTRACLFMHSCLATFPKLIPRHGLQALYSSRSWRRKIYIIIRIIGRGLVISGREGATPPKARWGLYILTSGITRGAAIPAVRKLHDISQPGPGRAFPLKSTACPGSSLLAFTRSACGLCFASCVQELVGTVQYLD